MSSSRTYFATGPISPEADEQRGDERTRKRNHHVLLRIPRVTLLPVVIVGQRAGEDEGQKPFEHLVEGAEDHDAADRAGKRKAGTEPAVAAQDFIAGRNRKQPE